MNNLPKSTNRPSDLALERTLRVLTHARERAHAKLDKVFEQLIDEAQREALAACPLSG